jgi:hypothetical protein
MTMEQGSRFDQMRDECQRFHEAHPEVWDEFVRLAFIAINRGHKSYGARTVWEVLRWNAGVGDGSEDSFKLNDHYPPFYARRFHRIYPDHDGFFQLREQKSKVTPASNLPPLGPKDFPPEQIKGTETQSGMML